MNPQLLKRETIVVLNAKAFRRYRKEQKVSQGAVARGLVLALIKAKRKQ